MAVEGATQALVAAFFFGIVLNAASAALVLYLRGYGVAAVFRDSQRLVLVLFLLSAALWAQIDFITILLDITTSSIPCQVGVIFSSVFDQLARFSIEQFLLWALNNRNGARVSAIQLIAQILVLGRFVAGAIFTGFTRPQTDTFCVATASARPVGILVPALDAAIILLLVIRAYSAGGVAKENGEGKGTDADRARALMVVLLSLAFWAGTSVPLLLGLRTFALATRTALPAGGLLVVIISVAGGAGTLLTSRAAMSRPLEAPSPRRINISRDISTSDTDYPPSRYEDLKEAALRSSTTFVNPRQVPRAKDLTGFGFAMGMENGFPNGLQGEPIPPLPTSVFSASALTRKKSLFGSGKGRVAISHPILQENAPQHPLAKIAVMDLKEAAVAERERRARMQKEEREAVGRPTRQWMDMSPEEGVKRAVSLKRKEVSSVPTRESVFPGTLRPGDVAVASTTSAQLSPGGEETRRRSPRPSLTEEIVQPQSVLPVQAPGSMRTRSESPPNRPLTLQQPLLKTDIRPSRMLPPSPKTPPPEPTKTPLQKRPTIGLPSNPRARGLQVAEDSGSQHRTILFVNNIEYNDPAVVEAIIKGAGNNSRKPAPVAETPGTSVSVVNRPRPIPRKPADSPAQSSPSLVHRRTKSSGSLIGRKSLLRSTPGSPSQLPPLPSLPTRSATVSARPHPNDTRSMTLDEKITLLFPTPPSAKSIKRRSSVPEVPRIPASYLDMDSSPSESSHRQPFDRTTKTSMRTESILEVDEIHRLPGKPAVNTTDEAGRSWLRAFGDGNDGGKPGPRQPAIQTSEKRASSPIIPEVPVRASAWTETTYDISEDDATNWSAMPSPELAVSVPVAQKVGLPASIQMPPRQDPKASQLQVPQTNNRTSSETVPFVLDTSTVQHANPHRTSPSESEAVAIPERSTWHRRVGDECPTFSARNRKARSRKISPPPPLSLNTVRAKNTIAIQVEPSPLESPGQAIRQIQAQLRKFEELEQSASPQSASRRLALLEDLEREMGQQAEHWQEIKHDIGRDSLSSMQTTSRRESLISAVSNVASESPLRHGIGAERRASRTNTRMRENGSLGIPDVSMRKSASPQLSNWQKRLTEAQMDYMDVQLLRSSNVNLLHLARAQLASPTPPDSDHSDQSDDEVPPVPSLPSKVATEWSLQTQLKPPSLWKPASTKPAASTSLLWAPGLKTGPETEAPLPGLSVRPAKRKELAPLRIQSSLLWRKPYKAVNRPTSGLWRPVWASAAPPAEPIARTPSKTSSPSQKPPRPVTQRPPRRNKRVTLLPDILESPKPLPDKQGTLGIFQFPWGEKSDTASISIQARPSMYMAMPGTMTSGGPSLGASFKRPEPAEYSSSFFDDYEDEDDDVVVDSDEEDGDDDDGFDETTLWEIASLLKTDSVPSLRSDSVLDDYAEESELSSDDDGESPREQIVIGLAEPRELLLEQQRDSATIESFTLLMLEDALESEKSPSEPAARVGLPTNPKASLNAPVSRAEAKPAPEMAQMHAAGAETRNKQGVTGLWLPPSQADEPSPRGGLFVPGLNRPGYRGTLEEPAAKYMPRKPRPAQQKPLDRLMSTELWTPVHTSNQSERNWIKQVSASAGLWFPPSQADKPVPRNGLFVPGPNRPGYRGTLEEPAAKYMPRKPRPAQQEPLDRLTSTELWTPVHTSNQSERNWIKQVSASAGLWFPPSQADKPVPRNGLFVPGSNRSGYRGTSEEPAAKYMGRKPRPAQQMPLGKLASTKLWTPERSPSQSEHNWVLGAPKATRGPHTTVPVRRYQRPQASSGGWKAALNEAIAASYPHSKKFKRVAAGPAEWKAALQEATRLSVRPSRPPSAFDSAVRHPVFAAASLVTRSEWLHPAATGYTYDVAAVHPVFFGSLAIACPEEAVHPAMSAYAAKEHLRRQCSSSSKQQQRQHEQRSDDSRKEEIGVLEQELPRDNMMLPRPVPEQPPLFSQRDSKIQAQIEALEQERLFVERAAQEEYRRRTTVTTTMSTGQYGAADVVMPAGAETVEDLQRRLSLQIRQSLVLAKHSSSTPSSASVSRSGSNSGKGSKTASSSSSYRASQSTIPREKGKQPLLWSPPPRPVPVSVPAPSGLWTPTPRVASHSSAASSTWQQSGDDAEAAAQRVRRRRAMQKRQRRAEILAQIAAVEQGLNPFVDFGGMELWSAMADNIPRREKEKGGARDWLGSVCVRTTRKGFVLRY
ncbi:hypothetical protein C8A03DRAFT_28965 [Achaetomium macrosporum]|uniref:Uncharacterized protein n=1 Tax=Achaetomium macrosporum TaxID=79813 RepID=A0AAN7HHW9_9PEZI|nr:hypothetical protein C8A03DRAFT_28965 [Achaetomium macrosporum]